MKSFHPNFILNSFCINIILVDFILNFFIILMNYNYIPKMSCPSNPHSLSHLLPRLLKKKEALMKEWVKKQTVFVLGGTYLYSI